MKLSLFKHKEKEDYIEIHYKHMTPQLEKIVEVANADCIENLYGRDEYDRQVVIEVRDIYYFEAVDKKCFAYTKSAVYQVQETLLQLADKLYSLGFVRINKGNVVNIYTIEAVKPALNMRLIAVLKNEEQLIINRSYKKAFQEYLEERRNII